MNAKTFSSFELVPNFISILVVLAAVFCLVAFASLAQANVGGNDRGSCSKTASILFRACKHEIQDDFLVISAKCENIPDDANRAKCLAEAESELADEREFCKEQKQWRLDACDLLGEGCYDPNFDPALFDTDFGNLTHPNPYFPLGIGYTWELRGGTEVNNLEVLNQTKLIDGVTCVVLRDIVQKGGELVENTDDWYAQAKDGNTWYCGEEVKDYESFTGDNPKLPELVKIDGSFKAGRDLDKPGIIFLISPTQGAVYLEEFSLGNAEDVTKILSANYSYGSDPVLDQFVPQQLVQLLCAGDCVVTENFSLLEPGIIARKYYANGIGFFLEVKPDTGEIVQLTNCNFDARCSTLPIP